MLLRGLLNQKLLLVFIRWACEGLQDASTMVARRFCLEKDHEQCLKSEVQPLVFQHIPTVNISHSIHGACCLHVPFKYNIWKLQTNLKKAL